MVERQEMHLCHWCTSHPHFIIFEPGGLSLMVNGLALKHWIRACIALILVEEGIKLGCKIDDLLLVVLRMGVFSIFRG
jgi:hypothetical protein